MTVMRAAVMATTVRAMYHERGKEQQRDAVQELSWWHQEDADAEASARRARQQSERDPVDGDGDERENESAYSGSAIKRRGSCCASSGDAYRTCTAKLKLVSEK